MCVNLPLYPPNFLPSLSKSRLFRSKDFQRFLWRFCGISRGYKGSKVPNPKCPSPNFSPPRQPEEPAGRGEGVVIVERHGNTVPRVSLFPIENRCCPLPGKGASSGEPKRRPKK